MNINQIMDAAKAKTGSDGKTAKALGLTRAGASAVRHHGNISNEVARKLAEIVGCSPLEVIAAAEIAKHPERRAAWEKWVRVACILIAAGAINMLPNQEVRADSKNNSLYIMRILRRFIQFNSAVRKRTPWTTCYSSQPKPA